ncbi:MAG: hypothetical protein ACRDXE_08215 [Acidimicrobiales bacterium]
MPPEERLRVLGDAEAVADAETFAELIAGAVDEGRAAVVAELYTAMTPLSEELRATEEYLHGLYRSRKILFVKLSLAEEDQAAVARASGVSSMIVSFAIGASRKRR